VAKTYKIVTQYPDVIFLGGTQTQEVQKIGLVTIPSNIYVEFSIPTNLYVASAVDAGATSWSYVYEQVAAEQWVVGVQWQEATNVAGFLNEQVVIYVSSTSGDSVASLTVLVTQLGPQAHQPQIDALHAQLDDAENL
jgi:hypothetical protein